MRRVKPSVLHGASAFAVAALLGAGIAAGLPSAAGAQPPSTRANTTASYTPAATGELDCNGLRPVRKPVRANLCTDISGLAGAGNSNSWDGKLYDNGH